MHQASVPSFGFFFMLALSAAIATLGLIANSAPAIIGAMIIAPLMSPIVSLSFGFVLLERVLILRSILTVTSGVVLVVFVGYISTSLIGLRITGSEVLGRTTPTLLDLGVAMAAGGAAAFSNTRRSILSSIAGVAIAVALVPPLAVTGIGLELGPQASAEIGLSLSEFGHYSGGTDIAGGAFLLFLTNFVGIIAVAILVFIFQRYGNWKKALLGLFLFLASSLLLFQPLDNSFRKLYVRNKVIRLMTELAGDRPDIISGRAKIESIKIDYREDQVHVIAETFVPMDLFQIESGQKRLDQFAQYLSKEIGAPVILELDLIPVKMVQMKSKSSNIQKGKKK
jgi:uncharacterized hydrophobic protein (TIGR00271 family)